MTFTPDVPSGALGPNEYNDGINVETDVRGIRSMAGDEEILNTVPGTPTFVSAGYRRNGEFWFIVATTEGYWYASNGDDDWYNITPGGGPIVGYTQSTNITEAWNGTIPFFNDSLNPPMFLPDEYNATLVLYSNTLSADIYLIAYQSPTTQRMTLTTLLATPFAAGEQIIIAGVNNFYDGLFTVAGNGTTTIGTVPNVQTVTYIDYYAVPGGAYPTGPKGTVSPKYQWNYNPNWKSYYAGWMRIYNTPNVGSILVAGNLTVTDLDDVVTTFPVTVQWSQNFGLNEAPLTWQPTVTNVANQLEVPLRGACVDAFPSNGQLFLCSYWDTVVFSPINYTTTSAPILGVRLFNQGRGLLTSNAWANTDKTVYGIDSRDIWVFDGNEFTGLGNQRVKNWFFDQLDPLYVQRIFMEVNTQRNTVEIYYTTKPEYASASNPIVNGVPNRMMSYRYDIDCWNAPREVSSATFACESPIWYGYDGSSIPLWANNEGSRTVVYARGLSTKQLVQKDQGYEFIVSNTNPSGNIESSFRRNNIRLLKDYSGRLMVHRILPSVVNMDNNELPVDPATSTHKGNITVTIEGANSVGSAPTAKTPVTIPIDANGATNAQNPWTQINQNAFRVNTLELSNTSNNTIWMCTAATWQITQVEDDR